MIQKDETKELAWVARIAVEDKDIPEFQDKINQKLDYYTVIADAPTDGVKKTVNPSRLNTVLRKDVVVPSMKVEDALKNAPDVYETSFKIPKIL
ncbi:Asp-tRNA(Asn)/Glu-tRNA(Gln) amidotransferase subunit GatC [Methanimicrococcus blatticola]|uniref:Aspartyl/glutamyl-tRNA(Asn/Gln) amidotransferase subunit C n=1 Tax=Methanimicrococcus blatticola TaxID=91560 RepID=A0A484F575_9EURY|nr:Asp-tRNA(Asn)/Glu-tRNA(Gln) amidotransferase subunit GatC [Methanimicrococcus blatticola]MBZ3936301.1 Asp-tRNA(Asn)/Glu-tRNA(Gln) amidotransferase subunit GatC [Methanimicrococcus blatticola]MCC2508304.1 Asp-tRNA(Asn)/Glu-tRNA(Gln) amidotransferase subunit GatC [Methanimicrococcus blatticola]TDQ70241.1 aspartyl/glutamyl-tRNA(Asn/Gln) amidotransferase subunit C [Methanimicrococcus blatticola]